FFYSSRRLYTISIRDWSSDVCSSDLTNTEFNMEKDFKKQGVKGFFSDLKSLVKGIVLIANVLPILSGFWLALYFTDSSFIMFWDKFLYMLIGGTLLMAGAL